MSKSLVSTVGRHAGLFHLVSLLVLFLIAAGTVFSGGTGAGAAPLSLAGLATLAADFSSTLDHDLTPAERDFVAQYRLRLDTPAMQKQAVSEIGLTASAMLALGRHANAAAALTAEVVRRSPDDALALNNFGAMLRLRGQTRKAIQVLSVARALRPHSPLILTNLGNGLLESGQQAQARKCFQAALAANPRFCPAALGLGYVELADHNYPAAVKAMQAAQGAFNDFAFLGAWMTANMETIKAGAPPFLPNGEPTFGPPAHAPQANGSEENQAGNPLPSQVSGVVGGAQALTSSASAAGVAARGGSRDAGQSPQGGPSDELAPLTPTAEPELAPLTPQAEPELAPLTPDPELAPLTPQADLAPLVAPRPLKQASLCGTLVVPRFPPWGKLADILKSIPEIYRMIDRMDKARSELSSQQKQCERARGATVNEILGGAGRTKNASPVLPAGPGYEFLQSASRFDRQIEAAQKNPGLVEKIKAIRDEAFTAFLKIKQKPIYLHPDSEELIYKMWVEIYQANTGFFAKWKPVVTAYYAALEKPTREYWAAGERALAKISDPNELQMLRLEIYLHILRQYDWFWEVSLGIAPIFPSPDDGLDEVDYGNYRDGYKHYLGDLIQQQGTSPGGPAFPELPAECRQIEPPQKSYEGKQTSPRSDAGTDAGVRGIIAHNPGAASADTSAGESASLGGTGPSATGGRLRFAGGEVTVELPAPGLNAAPVDHPDFALSALLGRSQYEEMALGYDIDGQGGLTGNYVTVDQNLLVTDLGLSARGGYIQCPDGLYLENTRFGAGGLLAGANYKITRQLTPGYNFAVPPSTAPNQAVDQSAGGPPVSTGAPRISLPPDQLKMLQKMLDDPDLPPQQKEAIKKLLEQFSR